MSRRLSVSAKSSDRTGLSHPNSISLPPISHLLLPLSNEQSLSFPSAPLKPYSTYSIRTLYWRLQPELCLLPHPIHTPVRSFFLVSRFSPSFRIAPLLRLSPCRSPLGSIPCPADERSEGAIFLSFSLLSNGLEQRLHHFKAKMPFREFREKGKDKGCPSLQAPPPHDSRLQRTGTRSPSRSGRRAARWPPRARS